MTEREKIIEILKQTSDVWKDEKIYGYVVSIDLGKIADALIEAGIGDVTEWKHRTEVAERAFDNTIKAFYEVSSLLFPDTKIDFDKWKRDNLANAEKEIAEEGKDD